MGFDPEFLGLPSKCACTRQKCVFAAEIIFSFMFYSANYLCVASYPDSKSFQIELRQAN